MSQHAVRVDAFLIPDYDPDIPVDDFVEPDDAEVAHKASVEEVGE